MIDKGVIRYEKYQKNKVKYIDVVVIDARGNIKGNYAFKTNTLKDVKRDFPTSKYKYINSRSN